MNETRRREILLVEDESPWIEHLKNTLIGQFDVIVATSTNEAIMAIQNHPNLSLVILDLMLSSKEKTEIDGPEAGILFLDSLRHGKRLDIPVIIYSAFLSGLREEIGKLGVYATFDKATVQPSNLISKIKEAIEASELRATPNKAESKILSGIRQVVTEEIERIAPIRQRTIVVPGETTFELIKPLIGYKADIEKKLAQYPFQKNVFLMMKFRSNNRDLSQFIIDSLHDHGLKGVRADQDEWNITRNVYNPIAVLCCCKYGIALFDEPETHQAYSPNVAYELGMMHYQNKDCLILKHSALPQVPFDIIKDLYVEYDKDLKVRGFITSWIKQVTE
jgi:CheY-like chemotaxis protein